MSIDCDKAPKKGTDFWERVYAPVNYNGEGTDPAKFGNFLLDIAGPLGGWLGHSLLGDTTFDGGMARRYLVNQSTPYRPLTDQQVQAILDRFATANQWGLGSLGGSEIQVEYLDDVTLKVERLRAILEGHNKGDLVAGVLREGRPTNVTTLKLLTMEPRAEAIRRLLQQVGDLPVLELKARETFWGPNGESLVRVDYYDDVTLNARKLRSLLGTEGTAAFEAVEVPATRPPGGDRVRIVSMNFKDF